jgi:hypothetical protein
MLGMDKAQAATVYTWIDGNANWSVTTDWSPTAPAGGPAGGAISTGNTATISGTGHTVTINNTAGSSGAVAIKTVNLGSNTLTINSGASLSTYTGSGGGTTLAGGTINGLGTINGPISGYGVLNALFTGNITASSATALDVQHSNSGTTTAAVTSGSVMQFDSGATVALHSGSVVDLTNAGTIKLNGATLQGGSGVFNATSIGGGVGQIAVTADSLMSGTFGMQNYQTYNIGGGNGAHTLNLSGLSTSTAGATFGTVAGGPNPVIIGTGHVQQL